MQESFFICAIGRNRFGKPDKRSGKDGKIFYKKFPAFSLTGPGPGARMESRMDKEAGK
jgi:hypothetical protein